MRFPTTRSGAPVALGLAAALALGTIGAVAFPSLVSAQVAPTATATPGCDAEGVGTVTITISDPATDTFEIDIDSAPKGVITGPATTATFGGFRNGDHASQVFWVDGDSFLTVNDVLVVCTPVPTTEAPTTTAAPAVAAVVATAPAFTG